MNRYLIILFLFVSTILLQAQNPISPPGVYIADPSARVWKNKMFIYGSLDESPDYYCSNRYHVLSSPDLIHWQLHRNSFVSKGDGDGVPYSDNQLYAPDCIYRNGTYYLYYCLAGNGEGVAASKSPTGPFKTGQVIKGAEQIDPAVFIDDDGQAYYYWGQFSAKGAKLNPDMLSIDQSTMVDGLVTEKEHFFHEGSYVIKHNGLYYFVYAHIGRQDRPTCIGYSVGKSPLGPFKYGGVIIDNAGCDPAVWNNHGSLVEFKGQWYVLYHRATHGSITMRKACMEPISFLADGSIPEVPMTSQGAGKPLDAFSRIGAENACLMSGNVRITLIEGQSDNEQLSAIRNGDRAAWKYIDFGKGATRFKVRVHSQAGGKIDIAGDYPWGASFGTINIPVGSEWVTLTCDVRNLNGLHTLWLRFSGGEGNLFDIDWFAFE
jgi:hypothetical protein